MSKPFYFGISEDHSLQDICGFKPPSYTITHGPDKALCWDPPADSEELAIALSYHFPAEKSLKRKMQAATEKFLRKGVPKRIVDRASQKPRAMLPISEAIPGLLSFDVTTLEEVKMKRKRRAYEKVERVKVGSNRGNACEIHRRQKLKCDPNKCKGNAQFQRNHSGQENPALSSPATSSSGISPDKSTLARIDISCSPPPEPTPRSSPQGHKPTNEPINVLFASSTNLLPTSNVPRLGTSNLTVNDMADAAMAEKTSQFMGFEPESFAFDDTFSFRLEPPRFSSHISDVDTRYSWRPDEFLLSVLSHSMYT